ncbi:WD40-repeat-containing domain protein [Zopfochytrium polystomum]|nr:WD40-repeat-containing domain protein [Zopfochytrium polystomum]
MGEFEDAWMDEEDDDEGEVIIDKGSDDEDEDEGKGKATNIGASNDDDDDVDDANVNVYLPGQQLAEGEVLVPDNTVYEMLHQLHVEWPCLSFDFLKDNLGINRKTFPMTSYMVAGSQADRAVENKIYVMKASELQKTKQDEMDDESDDEAFDDDPVLEHRTIPHSGSVNRIRAMPHHESLQIVSTWSENGRVYIWDLTQVVAAIDTPGVVPSKESLKPIFTVDKHGRNEGFAMDWSGANQKYRLLTGDIAHNIFLTVQSQATFVSEAQPFKGHESSVEDIQWSPSEDTVFASCSADKTIRIWDTRTKKKPQISWVAHDSDVNVISWNRLTDNLLASGSDSGAFSVWDLRGVAQSSATNPPVPAATFNWHRGAITSIEWHPFESSMLAAAGSDDQLTIWDLALERDPEEEAVMAGGGAGGAAVEVPPQLLFVHQGQQDLKELHWHKQMPGVLASTALSGFSIFKTINS